MDRKIKPMRGVAPTKPITRWPFLASPKIDGMRALVRDGVVLSKTLKPIPNKFVQERFGHLHGADGEITVGPPRKLGPDDDVFDRSRGPIMSRDKDANFEFSIFDRWDMHDQSAMRRVQSVLPGIEGRTDIRWLSHVGVQSQAELDIVYQRVLEMGFEGVMLRQAGALYKCGQSTENEAILLKFKPFEDSEAVVLDTYEQMENTNAATVGADGHTVRSTAKAGKKGKATLGGFHVQDIHTMVKFDIGNGTGLTKQMRQELWARRDKLPGMIMTYTFQKDGTKDKPRIPQFKGWRARIDISDIREEIIARPSGEALLDLSDLPEITL